MTSPNSAFSKRNIAYASLLASVVVLFAIIRAFGDRLAAPAAVAISAFPEKITPVHVNDFLHVLLALALVIAAARVLGALFRYVHQPPVIGEMIAGILLGPSFLGYFAPHFAAYVLPPSISPLLNVISQFGVILYMFLVGLELDLSALRGQAHSTVTISHASIVVPFILGSSVALVLYPQLSNNTVSFTAFSLFLGVSMSVTAFPVLARILTDRRIHKTKMGALALACAAIDDVSAWCLLALVVSVTQAHGGSALRTLLMAAGYIALMLFGLRPLVTRLTGWVDEKGRVTQGVMAFVLLAILLSSLTTESIGIHSIFGAFVLGAIIPNKSGLARELTSKLEDFVIVFLLPAFFAFTGLRTQIGLVSGARDWMFCLLLILVASAGKFGGSFVAARFNGLHWRDSAALGTLMNTRGLMELIVLNIGLELHVISPTLFAMLVIMALTTTFATMPILHLITPPGKLEGEAAAIDQATQLASAVRERSGVLIPVSSTSGVENLLDVASSLTATDGAPPRVLALNRGTMNGVGARVAEEEPFTLSRSPVLAAALDAAWSRKIAITPEAVWTTDAAVEIADAAARTQVRWVLLESRRSLFGRYPKRSVVNRVMESAAMQPVNIAVLLQSSALKEHPVTSVVCGPGHAAAAVELGNALAQRYGEDLKLLAVRSEGEPASAFGIPAAWDLVLGEGELLAPHLPKSGRVIFAKDVVDRWPIDLDSNDPDRSIILVQGAGTAAVPPLAAEPAISAVGAVS